MSDWRNYVAPTQLPSITVNVDDWMKEREQTRNPTTPEQVAEALRLQKDAAAKWMDAQEASARNAYLAKDDKGKTLHQECSECSQVREFYKDDYLCYQCRDATED